MLVLFLCVLAIAIRVAISRAEPILRSRVVDTLSARFKSRVELAAIHVWISRDLHVTGKGLKIYGANDPNPRQDGVQPLIEVREFSFQTDLRNLFRDPMNVDVIYVTGLTMNVPPKSDRQQMRNLRQRSGKMRIWVDRIYCSNTKLLINTQNSGKAPLEFDIRALLMKDIGPGQPLRFEATLTNPKPVGEIHSIGQFGPIDEQSPRDSAVQGEYSFTNADLGTLKGLGGILSSTGKYGGTLGKIAVDGETKTPDFRIAISNHPVPLDTQFHAVVDGTDGDTYLEPVVARVQHSSFTARGKVVRTSSGKRDIELQVTMSNGHIEDLLALGVKTDTPILSGTIATSTKMSLPPGDEDIADRLILDGRFHIRNGFFSNNKIQDRIDSLSLRSRGKPKLAKEANPPDVPSDLQGIFKLRHAMLDFSLLHFEIPGTHADMTGQYSLDGNVFDFHGTLKLDAKLSQMTTGWKSILLKPVDPFFRKDGAGTELPFKITGARSEPHFGLDFGHEELRPKPAHERAEAASR